MIRYSEFIDRFFRSSELLKTLIPGGPLAWNLPGDIGEADDATLLGGKKVKDAKIVDLIRGGVLYAVDAIHEAHNFFQEVPGDLGSYWHGMMHRREGDFDNARYWYRRAGKLPFFSSLHSASCTHSPTMARQENWDAYLLTGLCEQAKFGAVELTGECVHLQQIEFEGTFDYCWRQAVAL